MDETVIYNFVFFWKVSSQPFQSSGPNSFLPGNPAKILHHQPKNMKQTVPDGWNCQNIKTPSPFWCLAKNQPTDTSNFFGRAMGLVKVIISVAYSHYTPPKTSSSPIKNAGKGRRSLTTWGFGTYFQELLLLVLGRVYKFQGCIYPKFLTFKLWP